MHQMHKGSADTVHMWVTNEDQGDLATIRRRKLLTLWPASTRRLTYTCSLGTGMEAVRKL